MSQDIDILVVEDEADICELLQFVLEREGFRVTCVKNGVEGLRLARESKFSLALLDIMLPGMDGLSLCRKLREERITHNMPILMLTARSEESDVVVGLEVGADDYLAKPFSPKELVARIRALLRRTGSLATGTASQSGVAPQDGGTSDEQQSMIKVGPVVIDHSRHVVTVRDVPLPLTLAEFKLLSLLMSRPGRVFTRDQILEEISGSEVYVIDRNVDVHVRAIRRKLEKDSDLIQTVRGVGYKCRET